MSLNLYSILKEILKEDVSPDKVMDAMDNKYQVLITYSDEKNRAPRQRLIEPYAYGLTRAGNPCFRAYQFNGDTYRGVPKWKLFRLDRVTSWTPTEQHFVTEPNKRGWRAEDYNNLGDDTMSTVIAQVSFDDSEINPNNLYSPSDTLYNIRRQRQVSKTSAPININNLTQDKNGGPVDNEDLDNNIEDLTQNSQYQDMLKRNLDITRQEKMNQGYNINNDKAFTQRGPILPNDASEEDKEKREKQMKRERDKKYNDTSRKDLRWQRAADTRHLIPKKYRQEEEN